MIAIGLLVGLILVFYAAVWFALWIVRVLLLLIVLPFTRRW